MENNWIAGDILPNQVDRQYSGGNSSYPKSWKQIFYILGNKNIGLLSWFCISGDSKGRYFDHIDPLLNFTI